MSDQQTWKIIATPKDRWHLTVLLMHGDLKFKGKSRTKLYRFRQALGLMESTEAFLGERKGLHKLGNDNKTKNVFTVTAENAEFLTECLSELELHNATLAPLERILVQLEEKRAIGDVEGVPELDPETEDWTPVTAPILGDNPDRYVEVNAMLMRKAAGSFEKYTALYLKEVEPPAENAPTELKAVG